MIKKIFALCIITSMSYQLFAAQASTPKAAEAEKKSRVSGVKTTYEQWVENRNTWIQNAIKQKGVNPSLVLKEYQALAESLYELVKQYCRETPEQQEIGSAEMHESEQFKQLLQDIEQLLGNKLSKKDGAKNLRSIAYEIIRLARRPIQTIYPNGGDNDLLLFSNVKKLISPKKEFNIANCPTLDTTLGKIISHEACAGLIECLMTIIKASQKQCAEMKSALFYMISAFQRSPDKPDLNKQLFADYLSKKILMPYPELWTAAQLIFEFFTNQELDKIKQEIDTENKRIKALKLAAQPAPAVAPAVQMASAPQTTVEIVNPAPAVVAQITTVMPEIIKPQSEQEQIATATGDHKMTQVKPISHANKIFIAVTLCAVVIAVAINWYLHINKTKTKSFNLDKIYNLKNMIQSRIANYRARTA